MEGRNSQIGLNGHRMAATWKDYALDSTQMPPSRVMKKELGEDADGHGPPSRTILLERPIATCTTGNSNKTIDNRT